VRTDQTKNPEAIIRPERRYTAFAPPNNHPALAGFVSIAFVFDEPAHSGLAIGVVGCEIDFDTDHHRIACRSRPESDRHIADRPDLEMCPYPLIWRLNSN